MSHPDSHFRDKLYDLETPLGNRISFDEVMRRRKSARKLLWWKPVVIVLAGLFTIAGSAYFYIGEESGNQNSARNGSNNGLAQTKTAGLNSANHIDQASDEVVGQGGDQTTANNESRLRENKVSDKSGSALQGFNITLKEAAKGEKAVPAIGGKKETGAGEVRVEEAAKADASLRAALAVLKGRGLFKKLEDLRAQEWKELQGLTRTYNMPKKSVLPDFIEFSMVTGGNGYRNFDDQSDFSVRGNHQFSQYRAVALYSLPGDLLLGAGFISEWGMGAAQVRRIENVERMVIDSHTMVIIQPGLPPKNVVIKDTSMVTDRVSVGSEVSYRISKFAIPVALRYLIHTGRGSIRLGMDIAPGVLASQSGTLFNRNSIVSAERLPVRALSLDVKLSAGIQFALSSKTSVIAEPVLNMQTVHGGQWKQFNRAGLGFGLGFVYRL